MALFSNLFAVRKQQGLAPYQWENKEKTDRPRPMYNQNKSDQI